MIARPWRGWTAPEDAGRYERLLRTDILPDIAARSGKGARGAEVYRRRDGEEVASVMGLRFTSTGAVRQFGQFVGDSPREAYVSPTARALLRQFEDKVTHFEVVVDDHE